MSVDKRFYRNNFPCYFSYDEEKDTYFMYVGFNEEHPFYGSIFKTVLSQPLYKYNVSFENSILDSLWWMGYSNQTTYQKALDRFKEIIDSLPKA